MTSPEVGNIIDAVSRAAVGDLDARVDVDPHDLDDPIALVGNAVNLLLDDLAYRQRKRDEALRTVAAIEAKQEFFSQLSHDMQTPLAVIGGSLVMLETARDPDDLVEVLPLMHQATSRLQRFVQQLLDLVRLEAHQELIVEPVAVDVVAVVERLVGRFAGQGSVAVRIDGQVPPAYADVDRLEQILEDLLANAFRYARGPELTVRSDTEDAAIEVVVADRGPGLSPAELARVFGKFERISDDGSSTGAGLGLFISRTLAESLGGSLTATSVVGEGSRFVLRLPRADGGE